MLLPTPRPPARTGRSSARQPSQGFRGQVWQNLQVKLRPIQATLGGTAVAIALAALAILTAPPEFAATSVGSGLPTTGATYPAPGGSLAVESVAPSADPTTPPTSPPTPTPTPTPTPARPTVAVAIVPVTNFRATPTATGRRELAAILDGTSTRYDALELVAAEADVILAELGLTRPADPARLVLAPDAATLVADLAKSGKRLAFLRADAVGPAVRALAWGKTALFGVDRVTDLSRWPLIAEFPPGTAADIFDSSATWTLFAGGDILLDRGVYKTVVIEGKGVDFPFEGGTADIVGRTCCSAFGWEQPRTKRTGNAGAVRALISGADLAIVTTDNPRGESAAAIAEMIVAGVTAGSAAPIQALAREELAKAPRGYHVELNRRQAIHAAILAARPEDIVLIAGKGHEDYQIIGATRHPFDDKQVAKEALARRAQGLGMDLLSQPPSIELPAGVAA